LSLVFIWYLATGIIEVSEIRKKPYVGDDVKNQIVWTVIDNLVRFTWGTEDSVAWGERGSRT
jgi:hypothetical protein